MQIENLRENEVNVLEEKLEAMQEDNPELKFRSFPMEELEKGKNENEMLQTILDKVESLERKIDYIFKDHVLIDGQFRQINP